MPAPKGNTFGVKSEADKITGKGRIILDAGPLKARAVKAAQGENRKLSDWLREAIEEKLNR